MDTESKSPKSLSAIKGLLTSRAFLKPLLFTVIGGIAGYLYYHFIGCSSGSCAMTSNPFTSTLVGAGLGFFAVSSPCTANKC